MIKLDCFPNATSFWQRYASYAFMRLIENIFTLCRSLSNALSISHSEEGSTFLTKLVWRKHFQTKNVGKEAEIEGCCPSFWGGNLHVIYM